MKHKIVLMIALLAIIATGAAFAQTINGLWRTAIGNVMSIYDGKSVATELNDKSWKEAEKRGNISIGSPFHRNIRSTGNLTWTGQYLSVNNSTYATSWAGNATFTMSADGRTVTCSASGGTYTRR